MSKRILTAVLAALFIPALTYSQSARQVVSQPIEWSSLTSNIKVHKHFGVMIEGQFRFAQALDPMQFQLRTAAEVYITKNLSIVPIGYVYTWNPQYGKQPARFVNDEHRFWEQVSYKHNAGRFHFSHRGRLEQRHIQVHSLTNGEVIYEGFDFHANRFRYRIMLNVPFGKKEMEPKTFFASFYNEAFISWGPKVTYHKPDQNRTFVGVGYEFTKDIQVTSGFLYQMLVKANGAMQENNLGFQLMVNYNFDLTD